MKNERNEKAKKTTFSKGNLNLTEIVFILDKSGSMQGMERDTVGGFNSMIEQQKGEDGKALVTTVFFSGESQTVHDRKNLSEVAPISISDYLPCGCTALLDAIGETVDKISTIHKYAREEDIPHRTVFIITTDGMENASRKYTSEKVKRLIAEKEKAGWEFLFLAANIDAVKSACDIGIREERAANYSVTEGTAVMFSEISNTVSCFRKSGSIREEWKKKIESTVPKGKKQEN